jgi:hypothetical protein
MPSASHRLPISLIARDTTPHGGSSGGGSVAVWRDWRSDLGLALMSRRFPPPWSVEEPDPKLDRQCIIVRERQGAGADLRLLHRAVARRRTSSTRDQARRIAGNIAKLSGDAAPRMMQAALGPLGSPSTTAQESRPSLAPSRRKQHTFGCCKRRSEQHTGCQ